MDETIKAVAIAICAAEGNNPMATLGGDQQNFFWHEYTRHAEAAIMAMKDIKNVVDAAWIVLDDMGPDTGANCSLAAKAGLRVVLEPFLTDEDKDLLDYSLAEAKDVVEDLK